METIAEGIPEYAGLSYVATADGSKTIFDPRAGVHYHSMRGALQESRHVFLESGLKYFLAQSGRNRISVLEAGFGTGLNFLLSAEHCLENKIELLYCGIEAFPLPAALIRQSGYDQYVSRALWDGFTANYEKAFPEEISFSPGIHLSIMNQSLSGFQSDRRFDLLYFDAFAAVDQPEMWTAAALEHACSFLAPGGVFVTYAMNGNLKRNLQALGLSTEKLKGAAGKREMLRALRGRPA